MNKLDYEMSLNFLLKSNLKMNELNTFYEYQDEEKINEDRNAFNI